MWAATARNDIEHQLPKESGFDRLQSVCNGSKHDWGWEDELLVVGCCTALFHDPHNALGYTQIGVPHEYPTQEDGQTTFSNT